MDIQNSESGTYERLAVDGKKIDRYQVRIHLERYQFACRFAGGKDILDIASGEGYGSNMLARAGARSVRGIDIAESAVEHASRRYQRENLTFQVGNAQAIDMPTASADMIVSYETIEHLPDYHAYLSEVRRVLRPQGIYLVSTPNRLRESPGFGPNQQVPNPHHVREFTREELLPELKSYFYVEALFGQGLLHPVFSPERLIIALRLGQKLLHTLRLARFPTGHIGLWGLQRWGGLAHDPAYFVALCRRR